MEEYNDIWLNVCNEITSLEGVIEANKSNDEFNHKRLRELKASKENMESTKPIHDFFVGLLVSGFSEEQAFELTKIALQSASKIK